VNKESMFREDCAKMSRKFMECVGDKFFGYCLIGEVFYFCCKFWQLLLFWIAKKLERGCLLKGSEHLSPDSLLLYFDCNFGLEKILTKAFLKANLVRNSDGNAQTLQIRDITTEWVKNAYNEIPLWAERFL
jgi:hypothetical protein